MKELLEEIKTELMRLNGMYVTEKNLAHFAKIDKETENYDKLDFSSLIKKIENKIDEVDILQEVDMSRVNIVNNIENILKEMKEMNEVIRLNPQVSEVDSIYFDNKFGILKMEYNFLMTFLEKDIV